MSEPPLFDPYTPAATLQDLLRELRGANQYRGRAVWLQAPTRLLLECAHPQGAAPAGCLTLHVGPDWQHTYWQHQENTVRATEFDTPQAFLQAALCICRGKTAYIRTQDNATTYK